MSTIVAQKSWGEYHVFMVNDVEAGVKLSAGKYELRVTNDDINVAVLNLEMLSAPGYLEGRPTYGVATTRVYFSEGVVEGDLKAGIIINTLPPNASDGKVRETDYKYLRQRRGIQVVGFRHSLDRGQIEAIEIPQGEALSQTEPAISSSLARIAATVDCFNRDAAEKTHQPILPVVFEVGSFDEKSPLGASRIVIDLVNAK